MILNPIKLCTVADARLTNVYFILANELFGQDALLENTQFLKREVEVFVQRILAIAWNRWRQALLHEQVEIGKLKLQGKEMWSSNYHLRSSFIKRVPIMALQCRILLAADTRYISVHPRLPSKFRSSTCNPEEVFNQKIHGGDKITM